MCCGRGEGWARLAGDNETQREGGGEGGKGQEDEEGEEQSTGVDQGVDRCRGPASASVSGLRFIALGQAQDRHLSSSIGTAREAWKAVGAEGMGKGVWRQEGSEAKEET